MSEIKIIYATQSVAAFAIADNVYYIDFNQPTIFDHMLSKLHIPNFDSWIQANTRNRHSLQSLKDISYSFYCGLDSVNKDADKVYDDDLIKRTITEVKNFISDYSTVMNIEIASKEEIEIKLRNISDKFDYLKTTAGVENMYDYLCRIYAVCNSKKYQSVSVCKELIFRLGKKPKRPTHPRTTIIDDKVLLRVKQGLRKKPKLKNIPDEVINNVDRIQRR